MMKEPEKINQATRDYKENLTYFGMHPLTSKNALEWLQDQIAVKINENTLFQILTIEEIDGQSQINLIYGDKDFFANHFNGVDTANLPTQGAEVDEDFADHRHIDYPTIRFLLQSRRLSQMMAATWLNPQAVSNTVDPSFLTKIKYVKKIIDSYNIAPKTWWKCQELNTTDLIINLFKEAEKKKNTHCLISPLSSGYNSISLALLLCGQAYYKQKNDTTWQQIWELPIFSTYEMIWEYALELSWDTFYATRKDISQSGNNPRPPFTQVTLGYPPRPSEFNLKDESIKDWVLTPERAEETGNNKYPFYPTQDTQEWENRKLRFIVPPFPYIPLSST